LPDEISVRLREEAREERDLSSRACLSANQPRAYLEKPCSIRTNFQRDRDRVLHCKAFRRLTGKTQVFIAPKGDHFRNRLTHTLEVSQIARTIGRALMLNEDLIEAIALAHDLGHTPFGHAGEAALNDLLKERGIERGFHHARQSVRVVEKLEKNGKGLNLTKPVMDGIRGHTKGGVDLRLDGARLGATLESDVVRASDRIAYVCHDTEDAIRAGLIELSDIPFRALGMFGDRSSIRIDALVKNVVLQSMDEALEGLRMNPDYLDALNEWKDFLYDRVYKHPQARKKDDRVIVTMRLIFEKLLSEPRLFASIATPPPDTDDPPEILVADYLSGMTDRYAMAFMRDYAIPSPWE